jgi:hypothetical protein
LSGKRDQVHVERDVVLDTVLLTPAQLTDLKPER